MPADTFLTAIDELKPSDMTNLMTNLLKKQPTFGVVGDISRVPRYPQVASYFA